MNKTLLITSLLVIFISSEKQSLSQIVPDKSLGADQSTLSPDTDINGLPSTLIQGGATRGSSLFHSFQDFSISSGQSAYFDNPANIQTILTRVTGGQASNLLGTLGVLGNADLVFLNPSGILFGPDASLDLKGSFLATTANSVHLEEEQTFSANSPQAVPQLKISTPLGLNFGEQPQPITIRSFPNGLELEPEQTLAFIGGDININGGLIFGSTTSHIEISSLGQNSEVSLTPNATGWNFNYQNAQEFQDILLTQGAGVIIPDPERDGRVNVQGENLTITDGSEILVNSSEVTVDVQDTVKVTGFQEVAVPPALQELIGLEVLKRFSNIANLTFGSQDGDTTTINTKNLILRDGGSITTGTSSIFDFETGELLLGQARGGDLVVNASESVDIIDGGSALTSSTESAGQAGNIEVNAPLVRLKEGGEISVNSTSDTNTLGLSIPTGPGGTIQVNAPQALILSGVSPETGQSSGLFSTSEAGAEGAGGQIDVDTGTVSLSNGAVISTRTQSDFKGGDITLRSQKLSLTSGGQILSSTFGKGNSGDIQVNVIDQITLTGQDFTLSQRLNQLEGSNDLLAPDPISAFSGIYASSEVGASGAAGSIDIDPRTVVIQEGAGIFVNSSGSGPGGSIRLQSGDLTLDRGTISATSTSGQGGNITLLISDVLLNRNQSQISASAGSQNADGDGGNISVDTELFVAFQDSDTTANAFTGTGGNIQIGTRGLFLSPDSDITATSELGVDGVVSINNPDVDPSKSLIELPEVVESLPNVARGCRAGQAVDGSTFIHVGRGGLPVGPYETQSPPSIWQDLRVHTLPTQPSVSAKTAPSSTTVASTASISEAKGWQKDPSGHIHLVAHSSEVSSSSPAPTATC